MKEYPFSVYLVIAGLLFKIHIKNKGDYIFLKDKYSDYIHKNTKSGATSAHVFLDGNQGSTIKARNDQYFFPIFDLKKRFIYFNDLLRQAAIAVLKRHGGIMMHASSLVKEGRAYIFAGKEGSGKSTMRKLFPDLVCLGDDSAVIRKLQGQFFLFGSPFYQRTRKAYPNIKVPISGIFKLVKSRFNLVSLMHFSDALKANIANSFDSGHQLAKNDLSDLFLSLKDLTSEVTSYRLCFKNDPSVWSFVGNIDNLNSMGRHLLDGLNPRVRSNLPDKIKWVGGLADRDFLGSCRVINDLSWNFEFNQRRTIKLIADLTRNNNISSFHVDYVKKLLDRAHTDIYGSPVVVLEKEGKFTIIDGNHRAIALYIRSREKKANTTVRVFIGKLDDNETSVWF